MKKSANINQKKNLTKRNPSETTRTRAQPLTAFTNIKITRHLSSSRFEMQTTVCGPENLEQRVFFLGVPCRYCARHCGPVRLTCALVTAAAVVAAGVAAGATPSSRKPNALTSSQTNKARTCLDAASDAHAAMIGRRNTT